MTQPTPTFQQIVKKAIDDEQYDHGTRADDIAAILRAEAVAVVQAEQRKPR